MKCRILILVLITLKMLSGACFAQDDSDGILSKVNEKLNQIKTISFYQKRTINDPSVHEFSTYEGTTYLDFSSPGSLIDCRFQFENDKYLLVYNGTEDFEVD